MGKRNTLVKKKYVNAFYTNTRKINIKYRLELWARTPVINQKKRKKTDIIRYIIMYN